MRTATKSRIKQERQGQVSSKKSSQQKAKQQKNKIQNVSRKTTNLEVAATYGSRNRTGNPVIQRNKDSVTITHREYFLDLMGNSANYLTSPDQNLYIEAYVSPSNTLLFPWLSKMARLYEEFRFDKLSIVFQSMVSTSTSGLVLMAFDSDASDSSPSSKSDFMAYQGAVSSNLWSSTTLVANSKHLHTYPKYYTGGVVQLNASESIPFERQQFPCKAFITSVNSSSTGAIGELYVEYKVTLMTPQLSSSFYDIFSSRSADGPTSFFGLRDVITSGFGARTNMSVSFPNDNTISIDGGYDKILLILSVTGTGLAGPPTITLAAGIASTISTLVNYNSGAHGVLVNEIRLRGPGVNITLNLPAYTTLTKAYATVIPMTDVAIFFGPTI